MMERLKVVALVGSLRADSYNRKLLKAAMELAPAELEITEAVIGDLPLYNQELEETLPEAVSRLKTQVKAADAVLFITPEYNYSVPGVLKNAIDWLSRPYPQNSLEDKPAAIMGASSGQIGTARAQYHLRQMGVMLNLHFLNKPEVMLSFAADKFDAAGALSDEKSREKIKELLAALLVWINRLRG